MPSSRLGSAGSASRSDGPLRSADGFTGDSGQVRHRTLTATAVIVAIVGFVGGWIGALIAVVMAVPLLWKMEDHHFFGHAADDET